MITDTHKILFTFDVQKSNFLLQLTEIKIDFSKNGTYFEIRI